VGIHSKDPNQSEKATSAPAAAADRRTATDHPGWLTRAQVAAQLGYRSIFPIRQMEGQELHPVRTPRGWLFDPAEVSALTAKRPLGGRLGPTPEGRIAARVFRMFDMGCELRDIVKELELPPGVVRDLWHEWSTDLEEGEKSRRQAAHEEGQRRIEQAHRRDREQREQQEQPDFEKTTAALDPTKAPMKR
jgi:hypothetical protein